MTDLDRRSFLKTSGAVAGGAALAGPFQGYVAAGAWAARPDPQPGALVPTPDESDGVVRLALPAGFRYRSFHDNTKAATLSDGTPVPGRHDGMAAFRDLPHSATLVRNHEVALPTGGNATAFGNPATAYDVKAPG